MAEYIVAGLEITDPAQFQKYSEQVVATVRQYGGTYVIRGGQPEKLEGTWNPKRVSILEFPSAEGARAWYRSPEYSAIIGFRQRAATTDLVLVRGGTPEQSNWGYRLLQKILHPFAVFATPLFILGLMVYFLVLAFGEGIYPGVRSFAGALLPLIVVTFMSIFQKTQLERLGDTRVLRWGFFASVLIGFGMMALIRSFGREPIAEVVLSAIFSVLVFCYASIRGTKVFAYYYGIILGFLTYIVVLGFPVLR
ncbi:MAG TPA: DUF1330 domain-containing protein [Candidatus Acidoferrales bacterium]|jgi:uncharacterized protein (DUF1330 family)|nr:DUF1330 domain-containing protein [Candidatus Acidoferrales bacterium]